MAEEVKGKQEEPKPTSLEPTPPPKDSTIEYTEAEIAKMKEIFNTFTKTVDGAITRKDTIEILTSLKRNTLEINDILKDLKVSEEQGITFDKFLAILKETEKRMAAAKGKPDVDNYKEVKALTGPEFQQADELVIELDTKVVDFLRLLEEYRRKCVQEGNYAEAKKAKEKSDELKKQELNRQVTSIKASQEHELQAIEEAQKAQFLEFSEAWDKYMSDYEATAIKSLETMKEKHKVELEEASRKIREEMKVRMKYSKAVLEARKKEQTLVRLKKYDEAEEVKRKADQLEIRERQKLELDLTEKIEKKEAKIKNQQQLAIAALLKRIQRDRTEQLKQRQIDSQRLIQRNKNLLNDLLAKHGYELKKTLECVKQALESARGSEGSSISPKQQLQTALPMDKKAMFG